MDLWLLQLAGGWRTRLSSHRRDTLWGCQGDGGFLVVVVVVVVVFAECGSGSSARDENETHTCTIVEQDSPV